MVAATIASASSGGDPEQVHRHRVEAALVQPAEDGIARAGLARAPRARQSSAPVLIR
jgi:hypothetical protein